MDPIDNTLFSYNYQKFVLQDPNVNLVNMHAHPPAKPFSLDPPKKADKSKKDLGKQKKGPKGQQGQQGQQ